MNWDAARAYMRDERERFSRDLFEALPIGWMAHIIDEQYPPRLLVFIGLNGSHQFYKRRGIHIHTLSRKARLWARFFEEEINQAATLIAKVQAPLRARLKSRTDFCLEYIVKPDYRQFDDDYVGKEATKPLQEAS